MIYITKGQDKTITYQVKNDSGGIVDLTSAEITFTVKSDPNSSTAQIQRFNTAAGGGDTQIKIISASLGLIAVFLDRDNTLALTAGTLYYTDLLVTDQNSNEFIIDDRIEVRHGVNTSGTASISNILEANKYARLTCTYEDTVVKDEQSKFSSTISGTISSGTLTITSTAEFTEGKTFIFHSYDIYSWTRTDSSTITVELADWESGRINSIMVVVYS